MCKVTTNGILLVFQRDKLIPPIGIGSTTVPTIVVTGKL